MCAEWFKLAAKLEPFGNLHRPSINLQAYAGRLSLVMQVLDDLWWKCLSMQQHRQLHWVS